MAGRHPNGRQRQSRGNEEEHRAETETDAGHEHHAVPVAAQRPEPLAKGGPIYTLLARKYFVDELYEGVIVRRVFYRFFAGVTDWLDRNVVDGLVDLAGWLTRQIGRLVAQLQTGPSAVLRRGHRPWARCSSW